VGVSGLALEWRALGLPSRRSSQVSRARDIFSRSSASHAPSMRQHREISPVHGRSFNANARRTETHARLFTRHAARALPERWDTPRSAPRRLQHSASPGDHDRRSARHALSPRPTLRPSGLHWQARESDEGRIHRHAPRLTNHAARSLQSVLSAAAHDAPLPSNVSFIVTNAHPLPPHARSSAQHVTFRALSASYTPNHARSSAQHRHTSSAHALSRSCRRDTDVNNRPAGDSSR